MRNDQNRLLTRLGLIAAVVYALASAGAIGSWWDHRTTHHDDRHAAAAGTEPGMASAATAPPVKQLPDGPWVGFSLNLHHSESIEPYLKAIDEIADLGCTALQIVTPVYQENGAATTIARPIGSGRSATTEDITALLERARQRGLRTALMPIVLFEQPRGNEWRGKIAVENWDAWWTSYEAVMDEFLTLAREHDVDLFYVGSELISTEAQEQRWRAWSAHCRERFDGLLSYSTNWDHYHWPAHWDALDVIAINGYWNVLSLTDTEHPDDDAIAKRWRAIRESVLAYAERQRRPVLISELGYPSLPWAMRDPWNYIADASQSVDHAAQAKGYASFLAAWEDLLRSDAQPDASGFAGVMFYHWDPYHHGGERDSGYGIRGKPAEGFVRGWLTQRQQLDAEEVPGIHRHDPTGRRGRP